MCFDPYCGITTLLVFEVIYLIGFVVSVALVIAAGILLSDADTITVTTTNTSGLSDALKNSPKVLRVAAWVGIG